jgi:hypothetical protein
LGSWLSGNTVDTKIYVVRATRVSKCSTEEFVVLSVSARECVEFVQGPSVTVVCPDLL